MASNRKIVFTNGVIYHVFNRGVERRTIFTNRREFIRAQQLIKFYRHKETPIRYSQVMQQPEDIREVILDNLYKSEKLIDILSYCLMPNHFHFLLKQKTDNGIPTFVSNFTNAYAKYFNTKNQRVGPLVQGAFKAVMIESEEQLMHVSRYIHLNPVASNIIKIGQLNDYEWSSYPEYIDLSNENISEKKLILELFKSVKDYQEFVMNQVEYAKKLDMIKHLTLE
ncbi:transposase [Candidatus Daviesbacteria bacterium]|nr:transposase [Candidatus Daviesbacteria bacterium]